MEPRAAAPLAKTWRLAAAAALIGALAYGSHRGDDDLFPFGPMTQYSFRIDPDGEIRALWLDADDASGKHFRVDLSNSAAIGVARAELEGQLDKIVADPSRLQALATAWVNLNPDRPALTRLVVGTDVITLRGGREAQRRADTLVSWDVAQ
jgi:hypothetical protein